VKHLGFVCWYLEELVSPGKHNNREKIYRDHGAMRQEEIKQTSDVAVLLNVMGIEGQGGSKSKKRFRVR
jgi:hypothetical protein